jgi:OTU domain-containing protein 6
LFIIQAKIQALKKTASKGDKKKKKEVAEETAKLEAELDQRHEQELADLKTRLTQTSNEVKRHFL